MTILDLAMTPALVDSARAYFGEVQTKETTYRPLIRPQDRPAIEMNTGVMERYRPAMRRFYYDPSRGGSYLDQLGVAYPTLKGADGGCPVPASASR
jgi:aminobenzoyl-glutamate utilization protein B